MSRQQRWRWPWASSSTARESSPTGSRYTSLLILHFIFSIKKSNVSHKWNFPLDPGHRGTSRDGLYSRLAWLDGLWPDGWRDLQQSAQLRQAALLPLHRRPGYDRLRHGGDSVLVLGVLRDAPVLTLPSGKFFSTVFREKYNPGLWIRIRIHISSLIRIQERKILKQKQKKMQGNCKFIRYRYQFVK